MLSLSHTNHLAHACADDCMKTGVHALTSTNTSFIHSRLLSHVAVFTDNPEKYARFPFLLKPCPLTKLFRVRRCTHKLAEYVIIHLNFQLQKTQIITSFSSMFYPCVVAQDAALAIQQEA